MVLAPSTLLAAALALGQQGAIHPGAGARPLTGGWEMAPGAAGSRPDPAAFKPASVPGTFEEQLGADFDGSVWYRRTLDLPARGRCRLEFHGAATEARVYLNGMPVGEHLGAWTPFRVELDAAARRDGRDRLEVFLDEKVGHNTQGFHPIIQPHFGGLWQQVVLRVDAGPVLDRLALLTFGDGDRLRVSAPVLAGDEPVACALEVTLRDGAAAVAAARVAVQPGATAILELAVPGLRRWSPRHPNLYAAELRLVDASSGRELDAVTRRVGFRDLRAAGQRLLLDGAPLQVRGVLHWGYEPPLFAPAPDPAVWRQEMEDMRARGFNLVKACLWVPPRSFFEVADEVGMLVWQEYPTWHPKLTAEHRAPLVAEFHEFFLHDRSHVCVPFRSLTCETGHAADLDLIRELYELAHRTVPQTLVVDDSSWIGWLRVFDFYDDHPYGNNSWWPGKLASFRAHIAAREPKPLLLGECIAADTWFDRAAWQAVHGGSEPWWQPRCAADQPRFEAWVAERFGAGTLARLRPDSLGFAARNRKYQIERLRLDLPAAGYVVSVMRDFTLARMGLYDHLGRPKWPAEQWRWHGDTMICLDTAGDARAFVGELPLRLRIAHAGSGPLRGELDVAITEAGLAAGFAGVTAAPGTVSAPLCWTPPLDAPPAPRRLRLTARFAGTTGAASDWDLWQLPPPAAAAADGVSVVTSLDAATVASLRAGGRVVHLAGDRKRSLATQPLWFLRGAPFAPPHPLHRRVPDELLVELSSFDLESGRVLPWQPLGEQVEPILLFWDTHDLDEVRVHLLAFTCGVGDGRLLVSALNHDTPAGRWLLAEMVRWLADGEPPQRQLAPSTVAALAAAVAAEVVDLPEWRFRTDPGDEGVAAGWAAGSTAGDGWRTLRAGQHWEPQGIEHYDGVAWYCVDVDVPEHWRGIAVHAVFEGVDDSFRLYVNGAEVARFGDPESGETVWLQRVDHDIGPMLRPGERNRIALRVVDHQGAGGMWKPAYLTTGPVGQAGGLLH